MPRTPAGRPAVRAHLPVDVSIPQIVHHAARRAHHQAADARTAPAAGAPRAARWPRQQDAPQAGQKQQPDADRPVEPAPAADRAARPRQPGDPTRGDDVGMAGHARQALSASMVPCHNPACYMTRRPAAGRARFTRHAGQAHYLGTVMRRGPGAPCGCSTARMASGRPGSPPCARDRAAADRRDAVKRTDGGRRSAGWYSPLLKRDATDLVVQKATELGVVRLAAGDHRADQRRPGQRGPPERDRHRGGRAMRAADRSAIHPAAVGDARRLVDLRPLLLVAMERRPISRQSQAVPRPAALLIGPEGGFGPTICVCSASATFVQPICAWPADPAGRDGSDRRASLVAAPAGDVRCSRIVSVPGYHRAHCPVLNTWLAMSTDVNQNVLRSQCLILETPTMTPLTSVRAMAEYFAAGGKPQAAFRIGTEHEKFGFYRRRPCAGALWRATSGIRALLRGHAGALGWEPILDQGNIIGLIEPTGQGAISLEPGGQFELSGAPLRDHPPDLPRAQRAPGAVRECRRARSASASSASASRPKWTRRRDAEDAEIALRHHDALHAEGRHAWAST